jgi:hypothetical protein
VHGWGQLKRTERILTAFAKLLSLRRHALLPQPAGNLHVADDGRTGAFGDGDGIAEVVTMSVRDQDEIRSDFAAVIEAAGLSLK